MPKDKGLRGTYLKQVAEVQEHVCRRVKEHCTWETTLAPSRGERWQQVTEPPRGPGEPPAGQGEPTYQVSLHRGAPAPAQVCGSITEDSGLGQAVPEGQPGDGHGPVLALGG